MIKSNTAKQICTQTEYELFASSRPRSVKKFSEKQLKSRINRSRRARDKYQAETKRQKREARGKQAARGTRPAQSAQRTKQKVQLFDETLNRYESRLAELNAAAKSNTKSGDKTRVGKKSSITRAKKAAKKKTTKKKTTKKKAAKKKTVARKPAKRKSARKKALPAEPPRTVSRKKPQTKKSTTRNKPKTKAASTRRRQVASGLTRKQKHTSASGRRRQARRDSR